MLHLRRMGIKYIYEDNQMVDTLDLRDIIELHGAIVPKYNEAVKCHLL